jgi:hypothetical protein
MFSHLFSLYGVKRGIWWCYLVEMPEGNKIKKPPESFDFSDSEGFTLVAGSRFLFAAASFHSAVNVALLRYPTADIIKKSQDLSGFFNYW